MLFGKWLRWMPGWSTFRWKLLDSGGHISAKNQVRLLWASVRAEIMFSLSFGLPERRAKHFAAMSSLVIFRLCLVNIHFLKRTQVSAPLVLRGILFADSNEANSELFFAEEKVENYSPSFFLPKQRENWETFFTKLLISQVYYIYILPPSPVNWFTEVDYFPTAFVELSKVAKLCEPKFWQKIVFLLRWLSFYLMLMFSNYRHPARSYFSFMGPHSNGINCVCH